MFTNDRFPRASATDWEVVETGVRQGASIGANATIVCGVEIGPGRLSAAGAVVTRDVAPHELVVGNPARRLGWVCRCGRVLARTDERIRATACADLRRAVPGVVSRRSPSMLDAPRPYGRRGRRPGPACG